VAERGAGATGRKRRRQGGVGELIGAGELGERDLARERYMHDWRRDLAWGEAHAM
jgi:hypothetical protein